MKQKVINSYNKITLLSQLDSKVPQSVLIRYTEFSPSVKYVIYDTVVRNKLTRERFMKIKVENSKAIWSSRKYIIPTEKLLRFANSVLKENMDELSNSFLTEREIEFIVCNS